MDKEICSNKLLREYLRRQTKLLIDRGYHNHIQGKWRKNFFNGLTRISSLINGLKELTITKDNIPFLIVLSNRLLPISEQARLIHINGFPGSTIEDGILDEWDVWQRDLVGVIFDVDLGINFIAKPIDDAALYLRNINRLGLTTAEGLSLIRNYPKILDDLSLYFIGSRDHKKRIPTAILNRDGHCNIVITHGMAKNNFAVPSHGLK
jgi:hypothetical protein